MPEEVKHYQVNGKYRIVFERSAVKGIDGFKVEANDDDLDQVELFAQALYHYAIRITMEGKNATTETPNN